MLSQAHKVLRRAKIAFYVSLSALILAVSAFIIEVM